MASTAPSSGAPSKMPGTLEGHHSAASVKTLHARPRPPPRMRSDTKWNVSDARRRYRCNVTGMLIDALLVNGPPGLRCGIAVHSEVGETIGIFILFARHVLEPHIADLHHQHARLQVERLEPFVLHLIVAAHLLDDQLRVATYRE